MYSLVNAPTLGFDLSRSPTGAAVAGVLLETLALTPADALGFGRQTREALHNPARASAWLEVSQLAPPMSVEDALAGAQEALQEESAQQNSGFGDGFDAGLTDRLRPLAAGLTTASFGGLEDMLNVLRLEILEGFEPDVVSLAADALAAAYGGRRLPDATRELLLAPWRDTMTALRPAPAALGPFGTEMAAVLALACTLGCEQIAALQRVPRAVESGWSRRMHEAAWAAYLAHRLRPAAAGQLMAVRALRVAEVPAEDTARGVWNAVSGCLQALCLRDLLDDVTFAFLVAPWEQGVGPVG